MIVFSVIVIFFAYVKEKKIVVENIIQESTVLSLEINNKSKTQIENSTPSPASTESTDKNTESATVIAGNTTAYLSFPPNTVFYDALVQAKNQGQIVFNGKNYLGLGFFITDIETLHSGGGKDLLYYVNGKEATVGVSSYTLKNGDIIEWKLE